MQSFAEPHHARRPATAASPNAVSGKTPGQSDAQAMARVVGDPVAEPTPATRRAYAADWAAFVTWCRAQGHAPLPASRKPWPPIYSLQRQG